MPQFVGKTGGFLGSRLKGIGGEILYLVKNRSTLLGSFILEISRLILKVGSFFGDLILEITCLIPDFAFASATHPADLALAAASSSLAATLAASALSAAACRDTSAAAFACCCLSVRLSIVILF